MLPYVGYADVKVGGKVYFGTQELARHLGCKSESDSLCEKCEKHPALFRWRFYFSVSSPRKLTECKYIRSVFGGARPHLNCMLGRILKTTQMNARLSRESQVSLWYKIWCNVHHNSVFQWADTSIGFVYCNHIYQISIFYCPLDSINFEGESMFTWSVKLEPAEILRAEAVTGFHF